MRSVLKYWEDLAHAFGGDRCVLERLDLSADGLLSLLDPSHPSANRILDMLMTTEPFSSDLSVQAQIAALARFAPATNEPLRRLIIATLLEGDSDLPAALVAAEVLAEHFADDRGLRQLILERFGHEPRRAGLAAALAELALRRPDSALELLLREKATDVQIDVASAYKIVAAVAEPTAVVKSLMEILDADSKDKFAWHAERWLPTILRRIERDAEVQSRLLDSLEAAVDSSIPTSFPVLLSRAAGVSERLRLWAMKELRRAESAEIPEVGFDLSSQSYRVVRQVLIETLG